jgi:hypothetical protein
MPPSPTPLRGCLGPARWLLPWIGVLLVSAGLAYAMDRGLSSPRATEAGPPHEASLTPVAARLAGADAVADGDDGHVPGPACAALFGSYDGWLYSSRPRGPCGLGPDVDETPAPVR